MTKKPKMKKTIKAMTDPTSRPAGWRVPPGPTDHHPECPKTWPAAHALTQCTCALHVEIKRLTDALDEIRSVSAHLRATSSECFINDLATKALNPPIKGPHD